MERGEEKTYIGLYSVDITLFLKSHQNAQPTHPKLTPEN